MASLRKVRKDFRKEALRSVSSGDGNIEILMELAGREFGQKVGYEVLIRSFLRTEVSNAMAHMRTHGQVESIGRKWKTVDSLESADIDILSARRLKTIRGELIAQIKLCDTHGRVDDAIHAGDMLAIVERRIETVAAESESIPQEA